MKIAMRYFLVRRCFRPYQRAITKPISVNSINWNLQVSGPPGRVVVSCAERVVVLRKSSLGVDYLCVGGVMKNKECIEKIRPTLLRWSDTFPDILLFALVSACSQDAVQLCQKLLQNFVKCPMMFRN